MLIRAWAYFQSHFQEKKRTIQDAVEFYKYREPERYGRYPMGYKVYPVREYQPRIFPNFVGKFDQVRGIKPSPHPSYVFRTPLNLRKEGEK